MSYRYASPPHDLLRQAKWRKEKALAWFHEVTSNMSEGDVILECIRRGISTQGRTMHSLQTDLLQCEPRAE